MRKSLMQIMCSFTASLLLVLGIAALASAQTVTGTLQGYARDTNSAFVPGVTITIKNVDTGQERTVTTNGQGYYIATFMPLGRYTATAVKSGFGQVTRENVEVTLNDTTSADFMLNPTVTEAVTVTAEPPLINTTNAEVKGSLTTQEILDKPTQAQGNFLTLAETFTGFQENPTSGQNNPTLSSGSSINFNGTGTRGATFQINGVNNDDSSENQNRQGASLSTIKEFQVITNNFSAEFGRGYGAVVLVQTKSGTNKIKGDVYEYNNTSRVNAANNIFSPGVKKPVNRRNQYGFVVGFPLWQNKLFGFVSLEHSRRNGAQSYTRDLLTDYERNPANWFLTNPANNTPANRAFVQSVVDRFPSTFKPNDSRSARTFVGEVGFDQPLKDYSGRLDWNPREADNIFARWQYTRQIFDNQDNILGEATKQNNKQQNIGATWTHLFSAKTVGEFRYGLGLRTTLVGIKAGNDTPIIRFTASPVSGTIIGNAGAFPINRFQTDNQFVYNVSTLLGSKHFVKIGTDIRRQQLDDFADNFSRGFYTFNSLCAGTTYREQNGTLTTIPATPYVALINGCVATFQKGFGPFFLENRINETNFYAEDNWKVKPNLTLNLGARYEYVASPKEARNRVNYVFKADKNNYEPRVGFAYSPNFTGGWLGALFGGANNASIRAGYGIYHGRLFQSVFSQAGATVRFNPPNAILLSFTGANNLADPTNGFVFTPGPQTVRHAEARIDPGLEVPYTQQWNLSIERQMPFRSAIRVTYSGNRGIGLVRYAQVNLPIHNTANGVLVANHPNNAPNVLYALGSFTANDPRRTDVRGQVLRLATDAQCAGTGLVGIGTTPLCLSPVPLGPLEYSVRVPRLNERRPSGDFTTNTFVSNGAWSYYHGLQLEWNKKLTHGLTFQAAYTFSRSIDTTSEATNVGGGDSNINGPDTRVSRGLSRFHSPHRFTLYTTYQTPFFAKRKDFLGQALGGWQLSMVMKRAAGTPFTVTNGNGFGDLNFDGFTELRPALADPGVLGRGIGNPNTSRDLLPASAFRTPTVGDYNCCILGRNTFFADGVNNVDLGLYKTFRLWESHKLLIRADMFNAFNKVQYGLPTSDLASANFARITSTAVQYAPRNVQFSVRYQF